MWTFDIPYIAYVVLWIGLLVLLPVSLIVGAMRAMWEWRERRDGKKPQRVRR
jgi:hypothetical protein